MKLKDAPVGLFYSADGELCLKTKYSYPWGMDAYVVRTGEVFWGTAVDIKERDELEVKPVPIEQLRQLKPSLNDDMQYIQCGICGARYPKYVMEKNIESENGWTCDVCALRLRMRRNGEKPHKIIGYFKL